MLVDGKNITSLIKDKNIKRYVEDAEELAKIQKKDTLGWSAFCCPDIYESGDMQDLKKGLCEVLSFKVSYGLESSRIALEWAEGFVVSVSKKNTQKINEYIEREHRNPIAYLNVAAEAFKTLAKTYSAKQDKTGKDKSEIIINYQKAAQKMKDTYDKTVEQEEERRKEMRISELAVSPELDLSSEEIEELRRFTSEGERLAFLIERDRKPEPSGGSARIERELQKTDTNPLDDSAE